MMFLFQFLNRLAALLIFTLLFQTAFAQSEGKIESKLEKHFQKGNLEKCKKAAVKFKSKEPSSVIPYYYLSRIAYAHYCNFDNTPDKKQYRYLKQSTTHLNKISETYPEWVDSLKIGYKQYISSWNDSAFVSSHVKSAVKQYAVIFSDTLDLYWGYYKTKQAAPELIVEYQVPKTDSLRTALLSFASKWVGTPYSWAGEDPKTGFDCSGFVLYVYKHIGIDLPHSAQLQSELIGKVLSLEEAKPGDLIFFGRRKGNKWRTQHAGIYYGNENGEPKVIHCVSGGVSIDGNNSSWDYYWKDLILFVKRLPDLQN
ncbi:MAG TPA: hypothetical protein DDX98_05780 [Bacteroidales bacterium]|jgi:cell wall-associated NlpC family hydrolase|nr:hypothetical protein [Bacteroidales bacterium]